MTRFLLVLACALSISSPRPPARQDQEPSLVVTLECDGKKTLIEAEKPQEVDTGSGKMTVTLRVAPYRVFSYGGVTFRYPSSYSFKYETSLPGMLQWTMMGEGHLILVMHRKDCADAGAWMQNTVKRLVDLGEDMKESDVTLDLVKEKVQGLRLDSKLASMYMRQSYFAFQVGADAVMLMLQDGPGKEGQRAESAEQAEKMLRESFQLKKR